MVSVCGLVTACPASGSLVLPRPCFSSHWAGDIIPTMEEGTYEVEQGM